MVGGQIYVGGAELMTFSGPGCQSNPTPGIDTLTGHPCLAISSRGNALGAGPTPILSWSSGTVAEKVDVFDQLNNKNVDHTVYLNNDQLIAPTAQMFFVAYDVGDDAVPSNLIGVNIRAPSWFGLPDGDQMNSNLYLNVTKNNPLGTATTGYPFVGSIVAITPITLSVSGFTIAPAGAAPGQLNVPLLELQLNTNGDFTNISAMRITQLGGLSSPAPNGDFSNMSVWLDNGSGVFLPQYEPELGSFNMVGGSSIALVNFDYQGIPYLRVSTNTTTLYIAANISTGAVIGDASGALLAKFTDMLSENGSPLPVESNPSAAPPIQSALTTIAPLTVPSVCLSTSAPPVIVVRAQAGVPGIAVGQPAFAEVNASGCNNGQTPTNPRNNICRDQNGDPIPNQSLWICANGTPWKTNCPNSYPLIDINGDGVPDNFAWGASTIPNQVSLTCDGIPTTDLTGTGVLDFDLNKDGIVDMVFPNGFGGIQILLGNNIAQQGNSVAAVPVPDQGFVPSAWTGRTNQLPVALPNIPIPGSYQVAVGPYYSNPTGYSVVWSSLTVTSVSTTVVNGTLTSGIVQNLTLSSPHITHLTSAMTPNTTSFTVDDASSLQLPGLLYVGSEILRGENAGSNQINVISQAGDPAPGTGRGLEGSSPILHLSGEPVSDGAAILFARYVTSAGVISQPRAVQVFRPDPAIPAPPTNVQVSETSQTSYPINWTPSTDPNSGVLGYEIQERGGSPNDLAANVVWRTLNFISARVPTYFVGDPEYPGETPRPTGDFFTYQIRSFSGSGVFSPFSALSTSVQTSAINTPIAGVSNYPNPFDTRKGEQTCISYILGADSDVTITLYDLLGYAVRTLSYSSGQQGGVAGQNCAMWDGKASSGRYVAMGGYIARIQVKGPLGSSTQVRKIGVIH
jgi:hypothetical protein